MLEPPAAGALSGACALTAIQISKLKTHIFICFNQHLGMKYKITKIKYTIVSSTRIKKVKYSLELHLLYQSLLLLQQAFFLKKVQR